MPKFNLSINGTDVSAAGGFEQWSGPLPPKGAYPALLKLVQVKKIKDKKDNRLSIMVTLETNDEYHGCPVWGGVNLTDQGLPFVNQFLQSISTSEPDYEKTKKSFYAGFVVDEKKLNVIRIGTKKINSPEGTIPIVISLGHNTWNGETSAKILSFLAPNELGGGNGNQNEEIVEEDDDDDDESDIDIDDDDSDNDSDDVFEEEE